MTRLSPWSRPGGRLAWLAALALALGACVANPTPHPQDEVGLFEPGPDAVLDTSGDATHLTPPDPCHGQEPDACGGEHFDSEHDAVMGADPDADDAGPEVDAESDADEDDATGPDAAGAR